MRMWLAGPLMAATILSAALPSVAQAQERGERAGARAGGGATMPRGNWGARGGSGRDMREPRATVPGPARETIDATRPRTGGDWQARAPRTSPPAAANAPSASDRATWQQRRAQQGNQGWQGNRTGNESWRTRDRNGDGIADAAQREQWRNRDGRATPGNQNWRNGQSWGQDWNRQNWQGDRYNGRYNGTNNNWNRGNPPRLSDRDRWNGINRWDRDWRRDDRYDWQRWRAANRSYYHMPAYYAPYGWDYGYRRFSIGIFLTDALFASNYWIDDPAYYRLPPAYGTLRWIRYYDDALLVDMRDGYVVDVVYDFFW